MARGDGDRSIGAVDSKDAVDDDVTKNVAGGWWSGVSFMYCTRSGVCAVRKSFAATRELCSVTCVKGRRWTEK